VEVVVLAQSKKPILFLKKKSIKLLIQITTILILLTIMTEIGMNYWVRSSMRRELMEGSGMESQVKVRISWLNIRDFFGGKANQIWIDAKNCSLKDLRYSRLTIDSQGFWFDLPELITRKRLEIIRMKSTQIFATVNESALNEYLALRYPELNCNLRIRWGGMVLSGRASVFNKLVPIELEGDLKAISERHLRFYPTRLLIAGQTVSASLLKIVSEQLPIEFEIMKGWPLKISGLTLDEKKIELNMEDTKTKAGKAGKSR
jgi:hypothetical protein